MTELLLAAGVLALLALAAWRYGADSRDGRDWQQPTRDSRPDRPTYRRAHTPGADLASVRRGIGRLVAAVADAHRQQVTMWERYLELQRPWERDALRWVRTRRGWVLDGRVAPATPPVRPDETRVP